MEIKKNIPGNYEDKYGPKENFISKFLVSRYLKNFQDILKKISPTKIAEVGGGEGYLTKILLEKFPSSKIYFSDISSVMVQKVRKEIKSRNRFLAVENIEKTSYKNRSFDLVVCCEVLEHVGNPQKALEEIYRISKDLVLFSVPVEPLWRILNLFRGKYVNRLGNTPGHINHWTPLSFLKLLKSKKYTMIIVRLSLPWLFVLASKK